MKHPTWTPPINGWQYRIVQNCFGLLEAGDEENEDGFSLVQTYGLPNRWEGAVVFTPDQHIECYGTLQFCCAVLDAALKARKA